MTTCEYADCQNEATIEVEWYNYNGKWGACVCAKCFRKMRGQFKKTNISFIFVNIPNKSEKVIFT